LPRLVKKQILAWVDAYFSEHGQWPKSRSCKIEGTNETWYAVGDAMRAGRLGFSGRSSLVQFLHQYREVQPYHQPSQVQITEKEIIRWAKEHHATTGRWPGCMEQVMVEESGLTWRRIDSALRLGLRGLPGGSSLCRLLKKYGLK
jgi:hypothetical protein